MLFNSGLPDFFPAAFANAGDKNIIPATTTVAGAAALNTGWPPICSLPLKSGGKAPKREDLNGILYWLSLAMQRIQAGGFMPYNAAFATAIGGYPKGAFVRKAAGTGYWMSTADSNTTDPDGGSSVNWTDAGIAEAGSYRGVLSSSAATVTLTAEHRGYLVVLDSGSSQTLLLPQETGLPVGWTVTILKETLTETSHPALIAGDGLIDSGNGLVTTLTMQGMEEARLTWDGTYWRLGGSALRAVGEESMSLTYSSITYNTTYTNTTKSHQVIMLSVYFTGTSQVNFWYDGVDRGAVVSIGATDDNFHKTYTTVIGPGHSYKFTSSSAGSSSILSFSKYGY